MNELFILNNASEGMRAKLTRIAKGMRQIDVASLAHVDCIDITRLENNRFVLPTHRKRILTVLGLINDSNDQETNQGDQHADEY
jgi:transcriptional regulator with XRE-family HTH domain